MTAIWKLLFVSTALVRFAHASAPFPSLSPFNQALGVCANHESYRASVAARPAVPAPTVNGFELFPAEWENVQFIRDCVLPILLGEPAVRAEMAAKVTWWALREGILELPLLGLPPEERLHAPKSTRGLPGALRYSNCHNPRHGRDEGHSDEAAFVCPGTIWQVGIAAAQVDTFSGGQIEALAAAGAARIDPSGSTEDLLGWAATLGGFLPGSSGYAAIVHSTGRLRKSWLMRSPIVGFSPVQVQEVDAECLKRNPGRPWCTSHGYPSANRYGRTRAAMLRTIVDLRALYAEAIR